MTNDKPIQIHPKIFTHCTELVDCSRQQLFLAIEYLETDPNRTGEIVQGALSVLGAVGTLLETEGERNGH